MSDLFVSAHNYCDNYCERCPLRVGCEVARTDARRRRAHIENGVDPDHPDVVLEDVLADIRYALERMEAEALTAGVVATDEELAASERVISLAVERLERLGVEIATTARRLARTLGHELDDERDALRRELAWQSMLVARKCSRVATHLDKSGRPVTGESWISDASPNVILLEEAQRRLRQVTEALFDEATRAPLERAHRELERQLAPLGAAVPAHVRATLDTMIRRRAAPSPFCIE